MRSAAKSTDDLYGFHKRVLAMTRNLRAPDRIHIDDWRTIPVLLAVMAMVAGAVSMNRVP